VTVFAISGFLGLAFLLQTLHRLSVARRLPPPPSPTAAAEPEKPTEAIAPQQEPEPWAPSGKEPSGEPSALDALEGHMLDRHVKTVFLSWMVIFGLVGAQMAWVLRPFIGNPGEPFQWFRARQSNFFEAVWQSLRGLFW
jgi:hypothetical protein